MIDKSEVWKELLNGRDPNYVLAMFIIMLLALLLSLFYDARRSLKKDPTTPDKWSWKFFFVDSALRVVSIPILIYFTVCYGDEILNSELSKGALILIGFTLERTWGEILSAAKHTSYVSNMRTKLTQKINGK